jgi:hypothetical protein
MNLQYLGIAIQFITYYSLPELSMPKNLTHLTSEKVPKQVLHRDVHNLYGTL